MPAIPTASRYASPAWTTASFGHDADTLPGELSSLGEHLFACQGLRGRWFKLQCLAEATHGLLVAHFMTTLVGLVLLFAAAALAV